MKRRGHYLWACSVLALAGAAEAGETVTYSYDALGRLTATSTTGGANNGVATGIAYDPAGNRSSFTISGVNSPSVAGGGFESPEVGASYLYRPMASFTNNSGIAGNGSAWGFEAAPEGDQVAFLQGGEAPASISLPVTGLTPGASYKISVRISARPGYWGIPVTLSFNGAPLGTLDPPTTAFTSATSAAFTAGASSGTLVFSASGSPYWASGIDLVTVSVAGSN